MTIEKPIHMLARLEAAFRTDVTHLRELAHDLAMRLQSVRQFGTKHGPSDEWTKSWEQQWDQVEQHLLRVRTLVSEMHDSIESGDHDRRRVALEAWETIRSEHDQLVHALSGVRAQASALNTAVGKDWNLLARTLEPHLEMIFACAHGLRVKLELLEDHSMEEVDQIVQQILSKLPNRTHAEALDPETYQQEYDKAVMQLEQEQHKFLGIWDLVKSFWGYFESPNERIDKNRSVRIVED